LLRSINFYFKKHKELGNWWPRVVVLCVRVDCNYSENIWWCVNLLNLAVRPQIWPNFWWVVISTTSAIWFTSGTRDLRTPVATPLQPPRTRNGPDRRCAGIRTSRVYPQVINPGIYSFTWRGWENPKPRFWHFEPWFSKVLEIFENTLLYITTGSFGSGVGGEGKVFIFTSGAVGEGCDLTVIPSLRTAVMFCGDQVLVCTPGRCGNHDGPTPSQTDTGRPLLHRPLPPPSPKTPVTDRLTDLLN